MSRFARRVASLVVVSASMIPFAAAQAQPAGETVTVAGRAPAPLDAVGGSLTVIDARTIERRQLRTVFEALRGVPGLGLSRSGGLGALSQIRVRGAEANQVLVLIDGIEANDVARGGEFDFANLLTADVERIEALRGPQSSLWGADALAGVINVVTRRPTRGLRVSGLAEGGSFGTYQVSGRVSGGGEAWRAALDLSRIGSDGINVARTGTETDGYANTSIGASAAFDLAPNLALSASARRIVAESEFDSGFPLPLDTADRTETEQLYARADLTLALLDGRWTHRLGARLTDTDNENYRGFAFQNATDGRALKFDYQTNLTIEDGAAIHGFSFVAETEERDFTQANPGFPAANQDQSLAAAAIVGEYRFRRGPLALSAALRHDWNTRFDDATTWRVTARYDFGTGTSLRASAGEGVKNPDFTELFGFAPAFFRGNPDLKPERSFGFDAGVRQTLFGERLSIDVAYFRADLEDEIFTDFAVSPATARNRATKSEREGVEAAIDARLTDALRLSAAYTWTDTTENGVRELRRPEHTGFVSLDYEDGPWSASARVAYTGEQIDTDFRSFARVALESYALVSVSASYEFAPGLRVFARGENALDADYEDVFGYRTPGAAVYAGVSATFDRD